MDHVTDDGDRLSPRWALWSKHAGQRGDYGVLADSTDGEQRVAIAHAQQRLLPGSPRSESGMGALPWITFGPGESDPGGRIAVAIMEWPDPPRHDGTGRPISASRYFSFAYPDVAALGAGYGDLYQAVAGTTLPPAASSLVTGLPRIGLGRVATDIESLGFEWLACAAAHLLEGRVAITGATPPDVLDRIRCLDAVVALLPYGLRHDLMAGTWAPSDFEHRLRLVFTTRARGAQRQLRWAGGPPEEDFAGVGYDYLDWLLRLRERLSLRGLLELLRAERRPHSFADPDEVLATLGRTEPLRHLAQRLRNGESGLPELRDAMQSFDPVTVETEDQRELFEALADSGTAEDLELLAMHCCEMVVDIVADRIVTGTESQAEHLLAAVADAGQDRELRLHLVRRYAGPGGENADRRIVWALRRWMPSPGAEEDLRRKMLAAPQLWRRLLHLEIADGGTDDRVVAWVSWLSADGEDGTDPLLKALVALLLDGRPLRDDEVPLLIEAGYGDTAAVLAAAVRGGRLDAVLAAVGRPLLARPAASAKRIRDVLLAAQPLSTQARALADVVAVVHGGAADHVDDVQPRLYVAHVAAELTLVPTADLRRSYLRAFVRSLLDDDTVAPERTEVAFALADCWSGDCRTAALQELARAAEARRIRLGTLGPHRREQLIAVSQVLRRRSSADNLMEAAGAGVPDRELARLMAMTVRERISAPRAVACLTAWPGLVDPARVAHLLTWVDIDLGGAGDRWRRYYVHAFVRTLLNPSSPPEAVHAWRQWSLHYAEAHQRIVGSVRDSVLAPLPRTRLSWSWLSYLRRLVDRAEQR